MNEVSDNLVVRMLQSIHDTLAEHAVKLTDTLERIRLLERGCDSLSRRLDRVGGNIEQIKKRLSLMDEHTS